MTEQEANTKWCPMVRFNNDSCNRWTHGDTQDGNPLYARCIASDCMMWRWNLIGSFVNGKYDDNYPVEGYCGLGGKP